MSGPFLLEGAPIHTLDREGRVAEAMLVEGGLIKRTGSRSELRADHPSARRISLDGGAVVPAFNDCHMHVLHLGLNLGRPDLRSCLSVAEIQAALEGWAAANPEAGWVIGHSYDQNRLAEGRHILRQELDRVGGGRPVFIFHLSGHAAVASTRALELAGVDGQTPDPPDGRIVRDESGRATGLLLEMATLLVEEAMDRPGLEEMVSAILAASRDLAARGILIASDAFVGMWHDLETEWRAYARACEMGGPVRLTLMPDLDAAEALGWLDRSRVRPPAAHPQLRLGAMKIMADGALTSRTAALHEPFEDQATKGILLHEPEELRRRIVRAHQGGWQVAVHAIGDRAIDLALDGLEEAQRRAPRPGARHRIEHCMIMSPSILDRLAGGGIVACAQPEFMLWLAHAYRQGLGPRAERLMPYRTWLDRGIPLCFGSDQPVVPGDPITGWRAAVDRKGRDGTVLGAEEGLTPLEALKAFTVGSAYATFDEAVGTLTPGKAARFVVLSLPPEEILDPEMRVVAASHQLLAGG